VAVIANRQRVRPRPVADPEAEFDLPELERGQLGMSASPGGIYDATLEIQLR
jgi:hypothetical protein